jgi:hypothetical protein
MTAHNLSFMNSQSEVSQTEKLCAVIDRAYSGPLSQISKRIITRDAVLYFNADNIPVRKARLEPKTKAMILQQ